VINGLPPVWKEHSATGFFYTAFGGETMNVKLEALVKFVKYFMSVKL
jgi:hypothetical protein